MTSGVHTHLCFDGQEPSVSIQFDVLDTFSHPDDDQLQDVDIAQAKQLYVKLFKVDLPFLLILASFFLALVVVQKSQYLSTQLFLPSLKFFKVRPPLRAPPAFPA
jgi:hypothetical protein